MGGGDRGQPRVSTWSNGDHDDENAPFDSSSNTTFSPSLVQRSNSLSVRMEDPGAGRVGGAGDLLECTVTAPLKENDGTKDAFVSYLVTTHTNFPSFQKPTTSVRRRFTDFVYLHKTLSRDYISCAIPPMPTKERMEYVRGDRFGPDFTSRRAKSLQRFLSRLTQHQVLRRATALHNFLESPDWNAFMTARPARNSVTEGSGGTPGMFDNFADSLMNAFAKVSRPNQRFIEVRDKCTHLEDNLSHVEKVVSRVARREGELETDFRELAEQFQKLITLEPGVENEVRTFAASVEDTASGFKMLHDVTDRDYVGSLRDMQAYSGALKSLLKTREQKQLDYEQLIDYLNKSQVERDNLLNGSSSGLGGAGGSLTGSVAGGASSFFARKFENIQGVDPEQAKREKLRKLEMDVDRLTHEVSSTKKTSEAFDEQVVREVADFDRIRRVEFKNQLGSLADAHIDFCDEVTKVWEAYIKAMGGDHGLETVQPAS